MTFLFGHAQKSKFDQNLITSLGFLGFLIFFFRLSFFCLSYPFVAVIDLLLGLFLVKKVSENEFLQLFFTME